MIAAVRRQEIAKIVQEKKSATVSELARQFSVTEETIRRDLKALEDAGSLKRSYGGAYIQTGVDNLIDVNVRATAYLDSKRTIAKRSREFIHNGDTIFLDNSTTCYYIAEAIQEMRLAILTNSLMIVNLCAKSDSIRLVCIGGNYSSTERAFYGSIAVQTLSNYYVDSAFLSSRSLSLEHGITDSTDRWNLIRRTALERSERTYFAADHSKFDNTSFVHLCELDEVDGIITDKPARTEWRERLEKCGCILVDGS